MCSGGVRGRKEVLRGKGRVTGMEADEKVGGNRKTGCRGWERWGWREKLKCLTRKTTYLLDYLYQQIMRMTTKAKCVSQLKNVNKIWLLVRFFYLLLFPHSLSHFSLKWLRYLTVCACKKENCFSDSVIKIKLDYVQLRGCVGFLVRRHVAMLYQLLAKRLFNHTDLPSHPSPLSHPPSYQLDHHSHKDTHTADQLPTISPKATTQNAVFNNKS